MAGEENEKENGEKHKEVIRQGLCSRHDVRNVTKPVGHKLSLEQQTQEYKKIVQTISPLVGDAGVAIELKCSPISRLALSRCLRRARNVHLDPKCLLYMIGAGWFLTS